MENQDDAHVDGGARIVVGVDGSESSCDALRYAARQADLTGATVHAVIAWTLPYPYTYAAAIPESQEWQSYAARRLDEALAETLTDQQRARVRRHVVEGHPSPVLLRAARGAELLVVGSRGHGGFTGLLLGSVGRYLVTHASCPTLVVHLDDLEPSEPNSLELAEKSSTQPSLSDWQP